MALGASDNPKARGSRKTLDSDIPPTIGQDFLTSGREKNRGRLLGARGETNRCRGGKPQQILEPDPRRLLGDHRRRRHDRTKPVLIPAGGDDLGGRGAVEGTAGHKTEIPRSGTRNKSWLGCSHEAVENLVGGDAAAWKLAVKAFAQRLEVRSTANRSLDSRLAIGRGDVCSLTKQLTPIPHLASSGDGTHGCT